jgi:hypothetical protein
VVRVARFAGRRGGSVTAAEIERTTSAAGRMLAGGTNVIAQHGRCGAVVPVRRTDVHAGAPRATSVTSEAQPWSDHRNGARIGNALTIVAFSVQRA